MATWVGNVLSRRHSTKDFEITDGNRPQIATPRETATFIRGGLLQTNVEHKSLLLPQIIGCMVRFVQTWKWRTPPNDVGVFQIGWLVNNY